MSFTDGSSTLEVTVDITGSDTENLSLSNTTLYSYQLILQTTDSREFVVSEGNLEVKKKISSGS